MGVVAKMGTKQLWLDGNYKAVFAGQVHSIAVLQGENCSFQALIEDEKQNRICSHGDFGDTDEKIHTLTGKPRYNFRIIDPENSDDVSYGVVSDDGKMINCKTSFGPVFSMEFIDQTEAENIRLEALKDTDPYDAPSSQYTPKPDEMGKLIWISGAPGFGKSTTARRMSEKEGFVYYEGDAWMSHKNPYLPLGEDSAIDALMVAKQLRGVPKEIKKVVANAMKEWGKVMKGEVDYDLEPFYSLMCENILHERKRLGGDWVVAQAVPTRKLRDLIKSKLGPDLQFMVLNLDKDYQAERLKPRFDLLGKEFAELWMKMIYEPAGDGEENAVDLKITREQSLDDVVQLIKDSLRNSD